MPRKANRPFVGASLPRIPKLRRHKPSNRAVVSFGTRDVYVGRWGSKAAQAEYDRQITLWLANGRRLPEEAADFRVSSLIRHYLDFARTYYRPHRRASESDRLKRALVPLGELFGRDRVAEFGPLKLKALRQIWVEKGYVRSHITQDGLAAIGLGGVWNLKPKGKDELISDFADIDWRGRKVCICYDFDPKPKTRVQADMACIRLGGLLAGLGASVVKVTIPAGPQGSKQGIDDFLVNEDAKAFQQLVDQAIPTELNHLFPLEKQAGQTDVANALRLVSGFSGEMRYVGRWKKWLVWDGQRWKFDASLDVESFAKKVAADLWKEIAERQSSLDRDAIKAMKKFAKYSNDARGIRNMIAMAKSDERIRISHHDLNVDPWILNVRNGTIDLRSGALRPHRRSDLLTKLAPIDFHPYAKCPRWREFLKQVFAEDMEIVNYIKRLVGYCLTGCTNEHVFPFLLGGGANGKSTFIEILLELFGVDYALKPSPDFLIAKRGESHPTERADLHGIRFAACVETEAGQSLAESLVKELTGGDTIRARRMKEDFWSFKPTHKIWLASNHKPSIRAGDYGMWRRIKLIPFDVVFAENQQDKFLREKLRKELPGILAWAVHGCLEWQSDGLNEPASVRDATKEYGKESNEIEQFIDARCEKGPTFEAPASELFEAYLATEPDDRPTQRSFGTSLSQLGYVNDRITRGPNKGRHCWKGLRLRQETKQPRTIGLKLLGKPQGN